MTDQIKETLEVVTERLLGLGHTINGNYWERWKQGYHNNCLRCGRFVSFTTATNEMRGNALDGPCPTPQPQLPMQAGRQKDRAAPKPQASLQSQASGKLEVPPQKAGLAPQAAAGPQEQPSPHNDALTELQESLQKRTRPSFLKGLAIVFVPVVVVLVLARIFHGFASFMAVATGIIFVISLITTIFIRKAVSVVLVSIVFLVLFRHFSEANMSPQEKAKIAATRQAEQRQDQQRPEQAQAINEQTANEHAVAERRKVINDECNQFVREQLKLFTFKSGPKFEKPRYIDDSKGEWMTVPYTIITYRNQSERSVTFCHLGPSGEFQSLTGADEGDMPEWWSPAGMTKEEAARAKARREQVLFWPVPKKYEPLVKKAVELAKSNPHCLRPTEADYFPTTENKTTPFRVTCIVDNPRVPSHPYANYFFTKEQIEAGIARPHSTVGDIPVWDAQQQGVADELERTASGRCWDYIRMQASFPDSVERQHWYDVPEVEVLEDFQTGQPWARVSIRFQAKNYFGAELPYRAYCEIKADGILKGWIAK